MNSSSARARRTFVMPFAVAIGIAFLFVWLFAAALHNPKPHDLQIGVVGPAMVLSQLETRLENNAPGAFLLTALGSADEAREAIKNREIVGALVVGTGQPLIMVASAAGQPAAAAISGAFTAVAEALGKATVVEDVCPLPASDTRGLVPFFLVMGISISAFIFLVLLRFLNGGLGWRNTVATLPIYAVLAGLFAALAVGIVLGFDSGYWLLAGICALLALAVASGAAAFASLFGRAAGLALAGIVLILLSNASSGSVLGAAFLPQPFRWLSPVLPGGAGIEAVRSALYFDGAGLGWFAGALALWVAVSLLVVTCAGWLRGRFTPAARVAGG